jgi:hypothetical protein
MSIHGKTILIAIGVSMIDIRTAMALQKLKEEDYIVINNEQDALKILEFASGEKHLDVEISRHYVIELADAARSVQMFNLPKEVKHRNDIHKTRLNVRPRDVTRFRHPQMVRRG